MKTILVPTDFSKPAENAARYAMHIARALKANIHLCHAFKVPEEVAGSAQIAWPLYQRAAIEDECHGNLALLAKELKDNDPDLNNSPYPVIDYSCDAGSPCKIINKMALIQHSELIVMGMNGLGAIERLLLGSTTQKMIDQTKLPILMVPQHYEFKGIRKIAIASDLNEKDIDIIHSVAGFAKYFDAGLMVTHVSAQKNAGVIEKKPDKLLSEITDKVNYGKVYYRQVDSSRVVKGLDWLSEFGYVDLLVMIHRQPKFSDRIFRDSITKAQASKTRIPLLVFSESIHPVF